MLVLIGPPFDGTNEQYADLARLTGLVPYDLRTKLRPNGWGVVKALGDAAQAEALAQTLVQSGYCAVALDPLVGHDPERRIVPWTRVTLERDHAVLHVQGKDMEIPYKAMQVVVHGEVSAGSGEMRAVSSRAPSSSTFSAVRPSAAEIEMFRESKEPQSFAAFWAADLHFITVKWVARAHAREFDYSGLPHGQSPAASLQSLVGLLERADVRIDRDARHSSLKTFTNRPTHARARSLTPPVRPNAVPLSVQPLDDVVTRFDAYSRLVAEAERRTRRLRRELGGQG